LQGKGKRKLIQKETMKTQGGMYRYNCTPFLTSALKAGWWSTSSLLCFIPGKKTQYPFYRRLGGPTGRTGRVLKISPLPEFVPRAVHQVVGWLMN